MKTSVLFTAVVFSMVLAVEAVQAQSGITTTLTVTVKDEFSREPIPGVEVSAGEGREHVAAVTDAEGSATLAVPVRSEIAVAFSAKGYKAASRAIAIPEEEPVAIEQRLVPVGTVLTVFVRDRNEDNPAPAIGGARVKAQWDDTTVTRFTNDQAVARFIVPPDSVVKLEVTAAGFPAWADSVRVPAKGLYYVALMGPPPVASLTVVVTDDVRQVPIAGARVTVSWPDHKFNGRPVAAGSASAVSGGDGVAVAQPLSRPSTVTVSVTAPGFGAFEKKGVEITKMSRQLAAELLPSEVVLTVVVKDLTYRQVLPGATVTISYGGEQRGTDATGAEGTCQFVVPVHTDIDITASEPAHETYETGYSVQMRDASTEVELEPLMAALTVNVSEAVTSAPIDGANVSVSWGDEGLDGTTGASGVVVFQVPYGSIQVTAGKKGYFSGEATTAVRSAAAGVSILLEPSTGSFQIIVREKGTSTPVAGAAVSVTSSTGSEEKPTNASGIAAFDVPRRETVQVTVSKENYKSFQGSHEIKAQTESMVVELEPEAAGLVIHASSRPPNGTPKDIEGAKVTVNWGTGKVANVSTDSSGRVTVPVPIGSKDVTVLVAKDHYEPFSTTVAEVTENPPTVLAGMVPKKVPLVVFVVCKGQIPDERVDGATVRADWVADDDVDFTSDGKATVQVPYDTPFTLAVTADGYKDASKSGIVTKVPDQWIVEIEKDVAELTVLVNDEKGDPIDYANVEVQYFLHGKQGFVRRQTENGSAVFPHVPRGSVKVQAEKKTYQSADDAFILSGPKTVTLVLKDADAAHNTVIEVEVMEVVDSIVGSDRARHIPNATVRATWDGGKKSDVKHTGPRSNARFTLADGQSVEFEGSAKGFKPETGTLKVAKGTPYDLFVIILEREDSAGATLYVEAKDKKTQQMVNKARIEAMIGDPDKGGARSEGEGTLRVACPQGVPVQVKVTAHGYAGHEETTQINPPDDYKYLEVLLERALPAVRVVVIDQKDRPIAGAGVNAAWKSGGENGTTNTQGEVTLQVSTSEEVSITVSATGFKPGSAALGSKAPADVTIVMKRDDTPRDLLNVSISKANGDPASEFEQGDRFVARVNPGGIPADTQIVAVEWKLVVPGGKEVGSGESGTDLEKTFESSADSKVGTYSVVAMVHTDNEGVLRGSGAFDLKKASYILVAIGKPCYTGQWAAVASHEKLKEKFGENLSKAKIKGLDKFEDSKYWECAKGRVRFRPIAPGPQRPTFALVHEDTVVKCRGDVDVELTQLPVEINWADAKMVRKKEEVKFKVRVPGDFRPDFEFTYNPPHNLSVDNKHKKDGKAYVMDGEVLYDPEKEAEQLLTIDLVDKTEAVAKTTLRTPPLCECCKPPRKVLALMKKYRTLSNLYRKRLRLKIAGEKEGIAMNRRVADELATILEWGAGLKDCRHLSPKALKLFKRGSVYYRKLSRGKPDAGDLMEYWKPLAELGPKDIEPGFMKGFCDERNLPRR